MPINPGSVGSVHSLGNVRLNWIIGLLIAPHSELQNCLVWKSYPLVSETATRDWSGMGSWARAGRWSLSSLTYSSLIFPVFSITGILFFVLHCEPILFYEYVLLSWKEWENTDLLAHLSLRLSLTSSQPLGGAAFISFYLDPYNQWICTLQSMEYSTAVSQHPRRLVPATLTDIKVHVRSSPL